jgi:hypothetical protein
MKHNYTKEDIEIASKKCKSVNQMLLYFGLKITGGNWDGMKKRLIKYNIDYSHFEPRGKTILRPGLIKPVEEWLIVWDRNKQINTNTIKKALIKFGILEEKCSSCGLSEWLGKPITLEIHHKNGDRWDNRINNVEILCPNCHSLTNNYKSKNASKK